MLDRNSTYSPNTHKKVHTKIAHSRLINIVEMGLVNVYSSIVVCIKSVVEEYKVRTISTQLQSAFPLPCPGESGQTF